MPVNASRWARRRNVNRSCSLSAGVSPSTQKASSKAESAAKADNTMKAILLGLSVPLGLLVACKSTAERELGAEVARIANAVNELRDAPHNQKARPLGKLRSEECKLPASCELKQICLQAYTLHDKSVEATTKIRQALRSGQADEAGAAQLLEVSEADLERARQLMARCVSLQGELERETQ